MLKKTFLYNQKGSLEVICGPMFSGKSEELMKRLRRAEFAGHTVITIKNALDNRYGPTQVVSHDGKSRSAFAIHNIEDIKKLVKKHKPTLIGIEEIQFFPIQIVDIIAQLIHENILVITAGLDLDFRGVPFEPMPLLLALADNVTKLRAVCTQCGCDAHFSQRLINNVPAKYSDPVIMIGAQEKYQPRCRGCFASNKKVPVPS